MTMTMSAEASDPNSTSAKIIKALTDKLFVPTNVDPTECDHEFEFVDCMGTFCAKCHIGYGIECLHPECKVHHCNKHSLSYPACNNDNTFSTVAEDMTNDIYVIHLGHDGVISGNIEDVHKVLSYEGLKIVEYCGYYTDNDVIGVFEDDKYNHITFTPIY